MPIDYKICDDSANIVCDGYIFDYKTSFATNDQLTFTEIDKIRLIKRVRTIKMVKSFSQISVSQIIK
jgi:hypothetical protein